ncbi:MAG: ferritin family protein [Candidatus Riflebacteria bacterium]|nr:ferritin family protein [Candidatus Riflebacteria bacterium]
MQFDPEKIFKLALKIEKYAENFYRTAAQLCQEKIAGKLFLQLAEIEKKHYQIFTDFQKNCKEIRSDALCTNEQLEYFENLAKSQVFPDTGEISSLIRNGPFEKILSYALEREKDSIILYLTISQFISPQYGKKEIEQIIQEELNHVFMLTGAINQSPR